MLAIILIKLPLMAVLLGLSAFFSGSETAFFSIRRPLAHQMKESSHRLQRLVARLLEHPRDLLITILFCNMIVNILFYSLSVLVAIDLGKSRYHAFAPFVGILGLVLVLFLGEISPKAIAVHFPKRVALLVVSPIYVVFIALTPIRRLLAWIVDTITRVLSPRSPLEHLSEAELRGVLDLGQRHGVLRADQQSMMSEVLDLANVEVREIMVPRVEVPLFDLEDPRAELVELIREERPKFVVAYRQSRDNTLGILRSKDVLINVDTPLEDLLRSVPYVPETKPLDQLLRQLRDEKQSMAIVLDEYGGTEGIVTIEHVVEEIVGEIRHEHEPDSGEVVSLGDGCWSLAGGLPVHDLEDLLGISFENGDFSTLAGLILYLLGRLPEVGDSVRFRKYTFTVTRIAERRIQRVHVRADPDAHGDDSVGEGHA